MDTDSIILTKPKNEKKLDDIVSMGDDLGSFKHEYHNIIEFQALMAKFYYLKTDTIVSRRAKGIRLVKDFLTREEYELDREKIKEEHEKNIDKFFKEVKIMIE